MAAREDLGVNSNARAGSTWVCSRFSVGLFPLAFAFLACLGLSGCDVIYGVLHKPGGEEREILGDVVFNEYSAAVEDLQKVLRILGYPVQPDGKFGASTREAVARFQETEGLEVTRFVDKATWARLGPYARSPLIKGGQLNVRAMQEVLSEGGFYQGRIDGLMGPKTYKAVRAFQQANGLAVDGQVGINTLKALMAVSEKAAGLNATGQTR